MDHTALPYGINTPAGFLTVYMVMLPVRFKCVAPVAPRALPSPPRRPRRPPPSPAARARRAPRHAIYGRCAPLPSLSPKLADMYDYPRPATPEEFAQKAWRAACLANFIGG